MRHISGHFPIKCGVSLAGTPVLQRLVELSGSISATNYLERYAKLMHKHLGYSPLKLVQS